jgi:hypothetical protein
VRGCQQSCVPEYKTGRVKTHDGLRGLEAMLRATLTVVKRRAQLNVASALAELEADDVDFLMRHVSSLRAEATAEDSLLSRFHKGSGVPHLLSRLLEPSAEDIVEVSAGLAQRLQSSMDQATNPAVGVLAVIASGDGEAANAASVLKLDAINEAASFTLEQGEVRLSVLRDLLPAPGHLQKGLSWPDPRDGSQAIVVDRNVTAAKYFFNAYELRVSASSAQAERALSETIASQVPASKRAAAIQYASTLSGPAEDVVAQMRERYPDLRVERAELGAGDSIGGFIRQNKVAGHRKRYRGDGIVVVVPWDRLGQVTPPRRASGGWQMTIWFSAQPQEDTQ